MSLKGILPQEHLNCWILFVKASILLCSRVIYKSSLVSADLYLQQFCKKFQQLYGSEECTPNMHMHLHLKDSLSDYGPVYAFWCFAFERFNGVLGSYQMNNRQIEPQIMCKLLGERGIHNIPLPQMYNPFLQLLPSAQKGSLRYATCSGEGVTKLMELSSPRPPIALWITVHQEKKRY